MEVTILEATTDVEIERVLAVRNVIERPLSLTGLRAERSSSIAHLDLIAVVDGTDVGSGSVAWGPISVESGNVFIFAWVLPEYRRHGVGSALLDRLIAFARADGMDRMSTLVYRDDPEAVAYIERRGLAIHGGGQLGHLDLTGAEVRGDRAEPEGVTIETLADRPDLENDLYDLDMLVYPEIPFIADEPIPTFEAWQAIGSKDPGFLSELTLLALTDGRLVGAIQLYDNGDGVVFIGMTVVHPEARRRGIARLLKVELTRQARTTGWQAIETYNDGTNERIRSLNESIGYVYDPPYVSLRGPLPG
jgi:GNAT superfamily N-acetyltransferase